MKKTMVCVLLVLVAFPVICQQAVFDLNDEGKRYEYSAWNNITWRSIQESTSRKITGSMFLTMAGCFIGGGFLANDKTMSPMLYAYGGTYGLLGLLQLAFETPAEKIHKQLMDKKINDSEALTMLSEADRSQRITSGAVLLGLGALTVGSGYLLASSLSGSTGSTTTTGSSLSYASIMKGVSLVAASPLIGVAIPLLAIPSQSEVFYSIYQERTSK